MSLRFCRFYAFKAEKPSAIRQLVHPIGQDDKPSAWSNSGIDTRTIQQRKADFVDLEKNKQRRIELKKELAKSSYQAIYDFRDTGGKFFTSPKTPWSSSVAKYMPNFRGLTLDKRDVGTVELLGGKTTIVRIFSSTISHQQLTTYDSALDFEKLGLLDLNLPTTWINQKLVQWFTGRIRKNLVPGQNYLICRKGVTHPLRASIWADNELGGYLYVVDSAMKIRWAASGPASESDLESLTRVLKEI